MSNPPGEEGIVSSAPFLVAQLTAGKTPGEIEAALVEQGEAPRAARDAVDDALAEHVETLKKSISRDQLVGFLSLPFNGLIVFFGVGRCFFEAGIEPLRRVGLFVVALIGGVGAIDAIYRILRSRTTRQELSRMNRVWEQWEDERPRLRAVPANDGVPVAQFATAPPRPGVSAIVPPPLPARSVDIRAARPRPAKLPEDETLRTWIIGSVVGAVVGVGAFLLVLGLILSLSLKKPGGRSGTAGGGASSGPIVPPPEAEDPNAPLPDEGPPPQGWTVLFRADDPAVWNTDSPGDKFAIPVRQAHSTIGYLRLKRIDTGDQLILPIAHKQLVPQPNLPIVKGVAWNGTNRLEYGGYHLGIIRGPRLNWPGLPDGVISVMNEGWNGFAGSGFGHKINGPDKQCYAWQGKEIPRTTFEIAVTADPLTAEEAKRLTK